MNNQSEKSQQEISENTYWIEAMTLHKRTPEVFCVPSSCYGHEVALFLHLRAKQYARQDDEYFVIDMKQL